MKKFLEYPYLPVLLISIITILLMSSPHPQQVQEAFRIANLALESGSATLASSNLVVVASYFPWRRDLQLLTADTMLDSGEAADSIQYYLRAAKISPLSPADQISLGDAYLVSGQTQLAVQTWEQLIGVPGFSDVVLLRLLDLHRQQDDHHQVVEDLKAMIFLHPNQPKLYYELGLLLAVVDPKASLSYLAQAGEIDPSQKEQTSNLIRKINTASLYDEPAFISMAVGQWMASVGEWELARLAFLEATRQRPDYAEAWAFLGEAMQHSQQSSGNQINENGLEELQTALQIEPNSVSANLLMSMYWQRRDFNNLALDYLNTATQLEPENPVVQVELGRLYAILGDLENARHYYQQAVAINPAEATYWRLLAEFSLEYQVQVREIALPAARNTVMLSPQDPISYDLLGKTLLSLGDDLSAVKVLLKALELDFNYAQAHFHLGMVLMNLGDSTAAMNEFDIAEALAPDSEIPAQVHRLFSYYYP